MSNAKVFGTKLCVYINHYLYSLVKTYVFIPIATQVSLSASAEVSSSAAEERECWSHTCCTSHPFLPDVHAALHLQTAQPPHQPQSTPTYMYMYICFYIYTCTCKCMYSVVTCTCMCMCQSREVRTPRATGVLM